MFQIRAFQSEIVIVWKDKRTLLGFFSPYAELGSGVESLLWFTEMQNVFLGSLGTTVVVFFSGV